MLTSTVLPAVIPPRLYDDAVMSEKHVAMRTGPVNSYSNKQSLHRKKRAAQRQKKSLRKQSAVNAAPACGEVVRRFYSDYPAVGFYDSDAD